MNKISNFVKTNILPGAIAEVGLLCCACVNSNPEEAVVHVVEPMLQSVMSSLRGTPVTGYGGRRTSEAIGPSKVSLTVIGSFIGFKSFHILLLVISSVSSRKEPHFLRLLKQLLSIS